MPIDRSKQRSLLENLAEIYPDTAGGELIGKFGIVDEPDLRAQIFYLREHGLMNFKLTEFSGGSRLSGLQITAKGIDFITADGGASAILGTVIVKLHEETIRQLLISRIIESPEPDTMKDKLIDEVKSLPANGVKVLFEKVLDFGISAVPGIISTLLSATR